MNTYIGTKVINAKPMSRQEYNDFRGWELPSDEDGSDEGYLVEYVDGGKANTDSFDGYVSWSPKDVFERTYKAHGSFKDRVLAEKSELDLRIEKLENFVTTDLFANTVGSSEQGRMYAQLHLMRSLSEILGERIAAF